MNSFSIIITIIVTLYFIKKQFEYEKVKLSRYLVIPVFASYRFFNSVEIENARDAFICGIAFVAAVLVAFYQVRTFTFKTVEKRSRYYVKVNGEKQPVYRDEYLAKGGSAYLIGWIALFIVQVALSLMANELQLADISHEWLTEVLQDLLLLDRINGHSAWWAWELFAVSNLTYYIVLRRQNETFRRNIQKNE